MGTFSKLMEVERHSAQPSKPQPKATKGVVNRPPSRNCNIAIHITMLQSDIDELREPTYSAQTFRLRESDVESLKDTAYLLGKSTKKKVMQSDVARLAIRIAHKLATSKERALEEVIGLMK
jgi:hypothetical protein